MTTTTTGNAMNATPICLLTNVHYTRQTINGLVRMTRLARTNPAQHARLLTTLGNVRRTFAIVKAAHR